MSVRPAKPACFKAYDIRGRVPGELDTDLAYRIGLSTARFLKAGTVAVGRDCRLSSAALAAALSRGLNDAGAEVVDIGLCGTEMIYYATFARDLDGGVMVTASHNPMDHNGMKLVRSGARPISGDSGLDVIGAGAIACDLTPCANPGTITEADVLPDYIDFLVQQTDPQRLKPLRIVANGGNGCAGPVVAALARHLPIEIIPLFDEPDGNFPNGIPNPLLPEMPQRHGRGRARAPGRPGPGLGRRLRPLLLLRRDGRLHRGLLPGGPAGYRLPARAAGWAHHP